MRIGISVITHHGQNIWQNGLGRNAIFLAELFQCLPFVQSVLLIDAGDQGVMPSQLDLTARNLRVMRTRVATDEVDVIIEMSGALETPTHAFRPDRCDEVWHLPKHAAFAPMMRLVHRCNVHEVPYIWHPQFIQQRMREVESFGLTYGLEAREPADDMTRGGRLPAGPQLAPDRSVWISLSPLRLRGGWTCPAAGVRRARHSPRSIPAHGECIPWRTRS